MASNDLHIFISHAFADAAFALQLQRSLANALAGAIDDAQVELHNNFASNRGGPPAGGLWDQLIRIGPPADAVVVCVLSPAALASTWLQREWADLARARAETMATIEVVPILLKPCLAPSYLTYWPVFSCMPPLSREEGIADLVEEIHNCVMRRADSAAQMSDRESEHLDQALERWMRVEDVAPFHDLLSPGAQNAVSAEAATEPPSTPDVLAQDAASSQDDIEWAGAHEVRSPGDDQTPSTILIPVHQRSSPVWLLALSTPGQKLSGRGDEAIESVESSGIRASQNGSGMSRFCGTCGSRLDAAALSGGRCLVCGAPISDPRDAIAEADTLPGGSPFGLPPVLAITGPRAAAWPRAARRVAREPPAWLRSARPIGVFLLFALLILALLAVFVQRVSIQIIIAPSTSAIGANSSATPFTYAGAQLDVRPNDVSLTSCRAAQTNFTITNTGDSDFTWNATAPGTGYGLIPASGTLAVGAKQVVQVSGIQTSGVTLVTVRPANNSSQLVTIRCVPG